MDKEFLNDFLDKINGDRQGFERFFAALRGGDNKVLHSIVEQAVMLDDSWILTLEGAISSIEQIVHNPRKFIAENEMILDVSKVRRTSQKTVRHLSSHSQYVQSIDDRGEVTPKKLLSVELDEDISIYENRFICALINRLIQFVEVRYNDLDGKMQCFERTNVNMQSDFTYGTGKFKCNLDIQVEEPVSDTVAVTRNNDLFGRVQTLRRRLRSLKASNFMTLLDKQKPVRPPIQKTNLLTKNVDYNNCYKLWLYISSYTYLGYTVEVKDKILPVDGDYYDDLTTINALGLQSLLTNNIINKQMYEAIEFNPPQEKDYNIVTNMSYNPDFKFSRLAAGEESINEFYFRRMKEELIAAANEGDYSVDKKLDVNFMKFFRTVSKINDEMYGELIEDQIKANSPQIVANSRQKRKEEIRQQRTRIRRRKMYLKLKWEEVERAQRMCERAEAKLAKMQAELDKEPKTVRASKPKSSKRKEK